MHTLHALDLLAEEVHQRPERECVVLSMFNVCNGMLCTSFVYQMLTLLIISIPLHTCCIYSHTYTATYADSHDYRVYKRMRHICNSMSISIGGGEHK